MALRYVNARRNTRHRNYHNGKSAQRCALVERCACKKKKKTCANTIKLQGLWKIARQSRHLIAFHASLASGLVVRLAHCMEHVACNSFWMICTYYWYMGGVGGVASSKLFCSGLTVHLRVECSLPFSASCLTSILLSPSMLWHSTIVVLLQQPSQIAKYLMRLMLKDNH